MKNKFLKNHICRFNDGEHNCDCFVAGMLAFQILKLTNERFV